MGKKRMFKSIFGIPLWIIVGASLFIILSASYDWFVGDRSWSRYAILTSAIIILVMATILHVMPLSTIGRMAGKQIGR